MAQTFRGAVALATQAEKAIQRIKRDTSKASEDEAKRQLRAQERTVKAAENLDRQRSRGLFQQYKQQEAAAERASKAEIRARQRTEESARREIEKTVRAAMRALEQEERAQRRTQQRAGESFAKNTSHRATRFLSGNSPLVPVALRALGGVASGAGIDFSVAGSVGRVVDLEQQARDVSNSGFQAGAQGANGQRVDPRALMSQARSVGGQFGISSSDVLGGLAQYQKIAGDLDTGRQSLFQMAQLAKATGTSLTDMAAATANVSNGLGDIPNKAGAIDEVMRTIAGQGKLGAVEISDMATQMARIAAAAGNFGGDRAKNIQEFGALAQIARAEGGAPSAAEAARSMGGFASTLKKGARIKAFGAEGIDVFTDKTRTQLKDPIDIIKQSLLATGGDLVKMNKLFMDVVGARTVGGLQKTFVGAGGGQSGIAAVDAKIQTMMKAQMSRQEVADSAALASQTTASKAAQFQNQWDQVTDNVMAKLVPALEQSEEGILKFAKVVGDIATWALSNPKAAIAGAISLSIARAGLESALRSGMERLILGANNSRAGGVGSAAGAIGGVLTIASLVTSVISAAAIYADRMYDESNQQFSSGVQKADQADALTKQIQAAMGAGDMQLAEKLTKKQLNLRQGAEQDVSNSENFTGIDGFLDQLARGAAKTFIPGGEKAINASDQAVIDLLRQQHAAAENSKALLAEIRDAINGQNTGNGDGGGTGHRVSQ